MRKNEKSLKIYEEATKYIPGGVNSPVRAFKSVGLDPIFIDRAEGCKIYDVDGNEYIDYICSWGPLMLGHSPKEIVDGIEEVVKKGTSYGVPTAIEVDMAKLIVEAYPAIDQVRMVNSGTEATMSSLRVARAYTGRNKILKFEGCYHGHSDALLVKSGSGTITYGVPTSPGVPEDVVKDTLVTRYNDIEATKAMFEKHGNEIAAVILETVAGNMGVVPGKKEFIQFLRDITKEYGTVLIFDEVITGFRLAYNSSVGYYGIEPDMACFGKIIGAGLPVGAYGGKKEIMDMVSPVGPVYQAGTLSGNPLAMYMGKKNLEILRDRPEIYSELERKATKLEEGLRANVEKLGLNYTVNRAGSLVCLFFAEGPINNYDDVTKCNVPMFNRYFEELLNRGILLAPTQFEAMFLSNAHTDEIIDETIKASYEALKAAHNL
ncbi:glutamate-1-semialdehyde 2,1-aminomutase,Glutamate-1-semialdehyde 2,1-aminomutase,glutamate-1-semialdehyde aminotransferase,Glutamate-1-semialdehyde aminotransferase,glutamate-1-semialdehyde-2,1-aminomutase,Aminotransferase class-III [[Clostridium] sordellii]|uniref:glutamate-1-semialdehyde 2,1-aminomutase n=1 Tax=Paraclostridium sordellii TaxID=1505 RepID=UPI0005423496|nr:glutamate-1-semialdehyde 2,1-aminomutase [Paeniclostridium sordellii]CEK34392.1 glutamate-1-semialdehyde 2,1-aminomutase,Glutamate-1-semialdehyde 2,1-aminomutase,glutamate-1-semialdehyde aminotransferase,Glutamate-1-semialdehyde aminotransferase,glutamate-1-semialdehyde-2,1-aminomutase,Aminotransferase class-III [[Clostridium] sordellii] [Paeniclostridium sordellii]